MFKKIGCAILLILLMATVSWAGTYNVTASWELSDSATDLAGFELKINDTDVIDIQGADVRSWSDTIELGDGNNTFAVRAYDTAGQKSEWSGSVGHNPAPGVPTLTVIVVK